MTDIIDQAQHAESLNRDDAIARAQALAAAMARADASTVCVRCGETISLGRKAVLPAARHCVHCADQTGVS